VRCCTEGGADPAEEECVAQLKRLAFAETEEAEGTSGAHYPASLGPSDVATLFTVVAYFDKMQDFDSGAAAMRGAGTLVALLPDALTAGLLGNHSEVRVDAEVTTVVSLTVELTGFDQNEVGPSAPQERERKRERVGARDAAFF